MQVMKENGTKGKIPVGCFSASYEGNHNDKWFFTYALIAFLYFLVYNNLWRSHS